MHIAPWIRLRSPALLGVFSLSGRFHSGRVPCTDNNGGNLSRARSGMYRSLYCRPVEKAGNLRTVLPGQGKTFPDPQQTSSGTGFHLQFCKICCCLIRIPVMGKNIGGNMYVHTVFMGVATPARIFGAEVPGLFARRLKASLPIYTGRPHLEIDCCPAGTSHPLQESEVPASHGLFSIFFHKCTATLCQ